MLVASNDSRVEKGKLFTILVVLFVAAGAVYFFLPHLNICLNPRSAVLFYYIRQGLLVLQIMASVLFLLVFFAHGFVIQGILNCIMLTGNCVELVLFSDALSFTGIVASSLTLVICYFIFRDLRARDTDYKELNRIAFSDDLTGLVNRKKIMSTISNLIDAREHFTIMFIDMDNFKILNDSMGHQVGNIFLNEVVHNIGRVVDPEMVFGRMGGDEFLLIIPYRMERDELEKFAEDVNCLVSLPFLYKSRSYTVTCSIGIADYPEDADTELDLLHRADLALYRAKAKGKRKAVFYDIKMKHEFDERQQMEQALHQAIDNNELYLLFQPQFNAAKNMVRGYETLVRWKSPVFGEVSPSSFIPIAEENGDVQLLEHWIIESAFSFYVRMSEQHKIAASSLLTLNISFVEFRNPFFVEELQDLIAKTGMPPDRVELEITESVCVQAAGLVAERLTELSVLGIRVALDDFGIGYAALNYLQTLPFSVVKIDKSYVDSAAAAVSTRGAVVESVIRIAHDLNLEAVAIGIENEKEYQCLVEWGCDYFQGFYLSRPLNYEWQG